MAAIAYDAFDSSSILGGTLDAVAGFGSSDYTFDRTADAVPVNAVQSMQPITVPASDPTSGNWGQFFQDMTKTLVGYGLRKDAAQTSTGSQAIAAAQARAALQNRQLLLWIGLGVGLYLVARR